MGRWWTGQDQATLAELHQRHRPHIVRPRQLRQAGRGQAGAAEPHEADREVWSSNHPDRQQARPAWSRLFGGNQHVPQQQQDCQLSAPVVLWDHWGGTRVTSQRCQTFGPEAEEDQKF